MATLEQIYKSVMEKPLQILSIFNEYFGEDKVDMQGFPTLPQVLSRFPEGYSASTIKDWIASFNGYILVWWPHIQVTNEHDRSVDIDDLYAKVSFDITGKMRSRFLLNRATYTLLHYENNYMHSHISSIPTEDPTEFQSPCTGSGPINNTICSLVRDYDEDLWRLFCLELDRFVRVESLTGGPYHRLESLIQGGTGAPVGQEICFTSNFTYRDYRGLIAHFIKYLIDTEAIKFTYKEGEYCLAMSSTQANIIVSNVFIDWYNKQYNAHKVHRTLQTLLEEEFLLKCVFSNGNIKRPYGRHMNNAYRFINKSMCTFKNRLIKINITDLSTQNDNSIIILNPSVTNYIISKLINVINFKYGRQTENTPYSEICYL